VPHTSGLRVGFLGGSWVPVLSADRIEFDCSPKRNSDAWGTRATRHLRPTIVSVTRAPFYARFWSPHHRIGVYPVVLSKIRI